MPDGLINGLFSFGTAVYNNQVASARESRARRENYIFSEMSAARADKRQRALLDQYYTPEAQLEHLRAAGLSPSMMYQGTGSTGQTTAAQGSGASGIQPNVFGVSPIDFAAINKMLAETRLIDAQAKNVGEDTQLKKLANQYQNLVNKEKSIEFSISSLYVINDDNTITSLFDIASKHDSFDKFYAEASEIANKTDMAIWKNINSEIGNNVLRTIYTNTKKFTTDIKLLENQSKNAVFQSAIINALEDENFPSLSAKEQVAILRQNTESADLSAEQNEAWNNLLDKLGDGNGKDVVIVLGLLLRELIGKNNTAYRLQR